MNTRLLGLAVVCLGWVSGLWANTAPTVVIQSAAMRAGTTYMDVVYRVNDPDDATVKVRTLAFVDGVRSFAKVLRPVTFVENTASNVGDSVTTNADHTLTWNVGADWNIDLGQVKFEVLARDGRGLLPLNWFTLPAAGGQPEFSLSQNMPDDSEVFNALLWQYASGDTGLAVVNGTLTGSATGGVFQGVALVEGTVVRGHAMHYVYKAMNIDPAEDADFVYMESATRTPVTHTRWQAVNRPYVGTVISSVEFAGGPAIPSGAKGVTAVASSGSHGLALSNNGKVIAWGMNEYGECDVPTDLSGVIAIAAGDNFSMALKQDGTVIAWGRNDHGQTWLTGYGGVDKIAASKGIALLVMNNSGGIYMTGFISGFNNLDDNASSIPVGNYAAIAMSPDGPPLKMMEAGGNVYVWGGGSGTNITREYSTHGIDGMLNSIGSGILAKQDGTLVGFSNTNTYESYKVSNPLSLSIKNNPKAP